MLRAITIAALSLLASCCPQVYLVSHQADAPLAFEPAVLQEALRTEPDATAKQSWDGTGMSFDVARGPVRLTILCDRPADGGWVIAMSAWAGDVPRDDELRAAIALQRDVLQRLAAKVPGFPALSAFRTQWTAAPDADDEALTTAKQRWEAAEPRL
jgi:hypothetical protein